MSAGDACAITRTDPSTIGSQFTQQPQRKPLARSLQTIAPRCHHLQTRGRLCAAFCSPGSRSDTATGHCPQTGSARSPHGESLAPTWVTSAGNLEPDRLNAKDGLRRGATVVPIGVGLPARAVARCWLPATGEESSYFVTLPSAEIRPMASSISAFVSRKVGLSNTLRALSTAIRANCSFRSADR